MKKTFISVLMVLGLMLSNSAYATNPDDEVYRYVNINQDGFDIHIRVNQRVGINTSIFTLEDSKGNHFYAYCADSTTPPYPLQTYKRENLEDAKRVENDILVSYFSERDAAKLRSVLNNGFQLSDRANSLNYFKNLNLPGVADLTEDELIAATQAAVYTETNHAFWSDDERITWLDGISIREIDQQAAPGALSFYLEETEWVNGMLTNKKLSPQQRINIEAVYKYIVDEANSNPIEPDETDIFISEKLEASNVSQSYGTASDKSLNELSIGESVVKKDKGHYFLITRTSKTEYTFNVYYDFSNLNNNSNLSRFTVVITEDEDVVRIPLMDSNNIWKFNLATHIGELELKYVADEDLTPEIKIDIEGIQDTSAGYYLYQSAKDGFMSDHGAQNFVGWQDASEEDIKAEMEFSFTIPEVEEDEDNPPSENEDPPGEDEDNPPPQEDENPPQEDEDDDNPPSEDEDNSPPDEEPPSEDEDNPPDNPPVENDPPKDEDPPSQNEDEDPPDDNPPGDNNHEHRPHDPPKEEPPVEDPPTEEETPIEEEPPKEEEEEIPPIEEEETPPEIPTSTEERTPPADNPSSSNPPVENIPLYELGPDGLPLSNLTLTDPEAPNPELFELGPDGLPLSNLQMLDPNEIPTTQMTLVDVPKTGDVSMTFAKIALGCGLGLVGLWYLNKRFKIC